MPEPLLNNTAEYPHTLQKKLAHADLTGSQRVILLALNFIPLLHFGTVVSLMLLPPFHWGWRFLAAIATLYLVPPVLARLVLALRRVQAGNLPAGSRAFFYWWCLFQLQMIFCRLPFLEEILRLIPGAYSQWLRLWGAEIGRLTFWSAGTSILDRPFLSVGDNVIFGAGVRISSHVLVKNSAGELELVVSPVRIGDRVVVGGYSLLAAGTEVVADEMTKALTVLPPFSLWKNGKRIRPSQEINRFDDEE